jgi:diadenylate cyclase
MKDWLSDPQHLIPFAEIAILAVAFYVVLRFIRGTRGAGVFRGVLVFAVTFFVVMLWLTEELHLLRIRRILEWVLSTSLLALVVIFWPELRRAMIQIGRLPILRPFTRVSSAPFLDAVVALAERLSRNRIGALIAIERDMSLTAYAEEGVPVDAAVTPELLETIFYPRSILHDGAVILQHGRLMAAGCLLPLSDATNLDKTFGTRHRAAIGLTEETDAVVVVVSEETGRISVAEHGALAVGVPPERLRVVLEELYAGHKALDQAAGTVRYVSAEKAPVPVAETAPPAAVPGGDGPAPAEPADAGPATDPRPS